MIGRPVADPRTGRPGSGVSGRAIRASCSSSLVALLFPKHTTLR